MPLLLVACVWGCAAAWSPPPAETAAAATTIAAVSVAEAQPLDRQLAAALERAVEDPTIRGSLRLFAECRRDAGLDSVELYGNGVGIWNGQRQFTATPAAVGAALAALSDSGFASMPETFGGTGSDPAQPPRSGMEGGSASALRVVCRVELAVAGLSRRVTQLERGFQSPTFRALALELLRLCEEPARSGLEAADLADGLAKVAARRLAPESFHLILHRRPAKPPADEAGFLMRVDGLDVTVRAVDASSGYGEPRRLRLDPTELAGLAVELVEAGAQELPVNLWATEYTDLSIAVLGHETTIQARRFAGMEPSTHGERQSSFERLYARLRRLAARVMAAGREAPLEGGIG